MTGILYHHHFDGRLHIGVKFQDMAIEVPAGRKAQRHIRLIAKEYGITKIKRNLKNR